MPKSKKRVAKSVKTGQRKAPKRRSNPDNKGNFDKKSWMHNLKRAKLLPDDAYLKVVRVDLNLSQDDMKDRLNRKGERISSTNSYRRIERRSAYVTKERAQNIVDILRDEARKVNLARYKNLRLLDVFYVPDDMKETFKKQKEKIKLKAL